MPTELVPLFFLQLLLQLRHPASQLCKKIIIVKKIGTEISGEIVKLVSYPDKGEDKVDCKIGFLFG